MFVRYPVNDQGAEREQHSYVGMKHSGIKLCLLCFPNRHPSMKGMSTVCSVTIRFLRIYIRLDLIEAPCETDIENVHFLHPRNQGWMMARRPGKRELMMMSGERISMLILWRSVSSWLHRHCPRFVPLMKLSNWEIHGQDVVVLLSYSR